MSNSDTLEKSEFMSITITLGKEEITTVVELMIFVIQCLSVILQISGNVRRPKDEEVEVDFYKILSQDRGEECRVNMNKPKLKSLYFK